MSVKEKAIELYVSGYTYREIEAMEGMPSRMTICRWVRSCDAATVSPRLRGRRPGLAKSKAIPNVEGDEHAYDGFEGTLEEKIRQLELENDILRGTVEVLKGASLGNLSNKEKAILIEWLRQNTDHRLRELTDFLRISKSSYEYWKVHMDDADVRGEIADDVERIFREEGRSARGYRFVHAVLVGERGAPISEKIVRDVMRARNLNVVYKKKRRGYSSYEGELDEGAPNRPLDQETGRHDFHADAPNEKWVSDITEFRLPDAEEKVYLSPVVDLYDTKPVAWAISVRPNAELANSSLLGACQTLREGEHPWCHTDRGCHYRWPGWKAICEEHGVGRSMSRKGHSPDNAACEGFFGRLKNEFFYGRDWEGVGADEFIGKLDEWMRYYSEGRLKVFRENGKVVYDTIDNRRSRLGWAA